MKKSLIKISTMLLLTILMLSSFIFTSIVNAQSNYVTQGNLIALDMGTDEIVPLEIEDETIMEYDATTGITREVDLDALREKIFSKQTRSGARYDRIEPYDPLTDSNSNSIGSITPYATYNLVSNTSSMPYRAVCRIKADKYGKTVVASGYIAGPGVLVTAAHCVMNEDDNDAFFADWVAYPGYTNGSSYQGVSSGWSKVYYPNGYKTTHLPQYDWCICILNSPIGNTTGWCGTQSYGSNSEMNGLSVRLLGYPLSPGVGEKQYYTTGTITNTHDLYFDSTAKSVEGFSGGPVTRTSDDYVVGINRGHYNSNPDTEVAVRITQDMINIILENS